jgi:ElaB/YqjD/DUF883 family membrane-anchored ribosome-binding protein
MAEIPSIFGVSNMGHSELYSSATAGLQKVEGAARRSLDQLSEGVDRVRTQVARASDRTVGYVQDAPVRSALVVLAAGALVYAVVRALSRDR